MTEETATQISMAAADYAESFKTGEWFETLRMNAYIVGAQNQDPIAEKRGYNLAIQDCVEFISKKIDRINVELPIVGNQTTRVMQALKEELEKLKK
jgi:hypothetical protein